MLELFNTAAVVVGAMVLVLSFLEQITKLVVKMVQFVRHQVVKRRIRGLILTPTIEELARYSAPLPQRIDYRELTRELANEPSLPGVLPLGDQVSDENRARLLILMTTLGLGFAVLMVRLIQVTLF